MRWTPGRRSRNLEDRRSRGTGRGRVSMGRVPIRFPTGPGGRMGLSGIVVMVGVAWLLGINPLTLLTAALPTGGSSQVGVDLGRGAGSPGSAEPLRTTPEEEKLVDFVSFVLDDLQATWSRLLPGYPAAQLVLFRDATRSGCGVGQSEMGPFYCPADGKVYVDLSFYNDLRARFGAPGDFAQAYVLAHEIGHHIQAVTGVERKVRSQQRYSSTARNELSVRMELQADCLAGVWGHEAAKRDVLEAGDIEEGLRAAAAIGDDRIQKMSGRGVHPESFTHGSSEQRARWLKRGLESGDPDSCDTFSAVQP